MNVLTKDLDLLKVLVALGEELNLTRAAQRLRLSQPAMSHALKRLRGELGNPLFVRAPAGLAPTEKALDLLPMARELLLLAEKIYETDSTSYWRQPRTINLSMTTYFESRILVRLFRALNEKSPNIQLRTFSLNEGVPTRQLESGELDLSIAAYFDQLPDSYRTRVLGVDPHVCLMRKRHPYLRSARDLKSYLSFDHIRIAVPPDGVSAVDRKLAERGKKRTLVAHLNNFLTPPTLLESSDLLLTCPRSLAESYCKMLDLSLTPMPLEVAPVEIKMIWHERKHSDPFQKWLRELISSFVK